MLHPNGRNHQLSKTKRCCCHYKNKTMNKPKRKETQTGSMTCFYAKEDNQVRLMIPKTRKRPLTIMEGKMLLAAPLDNLEKDRGVSEIKKHFTEMKEIREFLN